MTPRKGLEYPTPDGTGKYDLFLSGSQNRKLVVLVHGGGWVSGDKADYHDEALWWTENGFDAACAGYRIAPEFPFPAAVIDVQSALEHFRTSGEWEQVFLFGNSAGGHLVLMAAVCPRILMTERAASLPDKVVAVCPITDLRGYEQADIPESREFLDCFLGGDHSKAVEASPAHYVRRGLPEILLLHGDSDWLVPVEQSRTLAELLAEAGSPVRLVELRGEEHSFTWGAWSRIRDEALCLFRGEAQQ